MDDVVEIIDKNSDKKIVISGDETRVVEKASKISEKDSDKKCANCKHEKRYQVNTECHENCKTSQCTRLECHCMEFVSKGDKDVKEV